MTSMKQTLYNAICRRLPRLWFALRYHVENEYQCYVCAKSEMAPFGNTLKKQMALNSVFSSIVRDQTVLEIGCDTGFFPLYAALCGASRATGVDRNRHALAKAERARRIMRMPQVEFRCGTIPDLDLDAKYDTVFFLSAIHYMFSGTCGNHVLFDRMDAFVRFISPYAGKYLAIEFVEPADEAAALLVDPRFIESGDYSAASLLTSLRRHFEVIVDLDRTHYATRRLYLAVRRKDLLPELAIAGSA
jgi:SAM-dependent methyltransferase